jgi:tRNA (uracil-5-)-methyltransferase
MAETLNPLSTPSSEQQHGEKRTRAELESEEPPKASPLHALWKTSLCSYYRRSGGECSHGEGCRYAHGEDELRPRPDNTWDPTSERAKKLMKSTDEDKSRGSDIDGEDEVLMTESIGEDCSSDSALQKCLVNLPMRWISENLRSFLTEQGISYKSAKKNKGMTVGFVTFETLEQKKAAVEELDGKLVGNKNLTVADVIPRSFEKKNDNDDTEASESSRSARDVVTPLAHMSYADQLEHKKNSLAQTLKKLTRNARKACPNGISLPEWILKAREIGGLPCKLDGIIESPLANGYRNKCEFSVGYSQQGKPTVGFSIGNFREGVTAVEEPVDCPNVSRIACKYAEIFQDCLRDSGLPIWNRLNNTGFWRQLTVREGRAPGEVLEVENLESNIEEVLVMVQICSKDFEEKVVNDELEKIAQVFAAGASASTPPLPLTALVVQDHQGISNVAPADAPLRALHIPETESDSKQAITTSLTAREDIHDYINNLKFRISPTAFFQVNTLAAEKLYSLAGDWADLGPDTLLFDVCCGTGTIGLTLAHRVGMVVGIEMNASAVSDANMNADTNGVKNCRFVCGKAEDVIGSLLNEYLDSMEKTDETLVKNDGENVGENVEETQIETLKETRFKNIVAIVDPPRVGLHPTVIKALRTHPRLKRLVYISCNPESLVANAIELCTPSPDITEKGNKNNRGWRNMSSAGLARHRAKSMPTSEPFRPVKAMAVDLFPHTPHCELVMLLER